MGQDIRYAQEEVGFFRLWYGYFAGAAAWTAMHLISYLWASVACGTRAEILIHATTVVTSAITISAIWICYGNLKKLEGKDLQSPGVFRFMLYSGLYLNVLFLLTILATGAGVFFLDTCR